jgi:hypothetical protein
MRPFVWHPQTNPFPKTKVDRFSRKKTISKNVGHSIMEIPDNERSISRIGATKTPFLQNKCTHASF